MNSDTSSPNGRELDEPAFHGRQQFQKEAGVEIADEEYAAELAPVAAPKIRRPSSEDMNSRADIEAFVTDDSDTAAAQNKTLGVVALVLAAISLFFLPAILGPASVVVGFAAYVRGNRTLGVWSMALGVLAVAAYYVLVPYYT